MEYSKHIEQIIITLASLLAFLIVSSAIVKVMQIIHDYRLKRMLIEEGASGDFPEFLSQKYLALQHIMANLKWALLTLFMSLGLIIGPSIIDINLQNPIFYGYLLLYLGLGLMAYFLIAKRVLLKEKNKAESHD